MFTTFNIFNDLLILFIRSTAVSKSYRLILIRILYWYHNYDIDSFSSPILILRYWYHNYDIGSFSSPILILRYWYQNYDIDSFSSPILILRYTLIMILIVSHRRYWYFDTDTKQWYLEFLIADTMLIPQLWYWQFLIGDTDTLTMVLRDSHRWYWYHNYGAW